MSKVVVQLNFKPVLAQEKRAVGQVIRKVTFDAEADMKQAAPVDTGYLRSSIQSEFEGEMTGVIGVGAEYGHFVEYGTSRAAAQPYFEPAMERAKQTLERVAKDMLK